MKIKKIILLSTLFIMIFSCKNDDDATDNTSETQINLVTGVALVSDEFSAPLVLGNPNDFVNNIIFYPNPTINQINVSNRLNNNISGFWIVKADEKKIFQQTNFNSILNANLYSDADLNSNSIRKESGLSAQKLYVNLENMEVGYYRMFIEVDDEIEWFNFYKGAPEIEELVAFWNN